MIIDARAYAQMLGHLRGVHPREGCGLLAGPHLYPKAPCPRDTDGDGNCGRRFCSHCGVPELRETVVGVWVPMDNVAEHPRSRYEMDPEGLLNAWRQLDERGMRPWVVVHSHTHASDTATMSQPDVALAGDETLAHAVVSLPGSPTAEPVIRLWRVPLGTGVPVRVRYEVRDLAFRTIGNSDLTRRVSGD